MEQLFSFELFAVCALGGLAGTYLMDVTAGVLRAYQIRSGTSLELIGRWFGYLLRGTMYHGAIESAQALPSEKGYGLFFHYIIAGAGIALLYPLVLYVLQPDGWQEHLLAIGVFGIATNIFPWLWMMPSFGWGIAGIKREPKAQTIVAPLFTHMAHAFGVGAAVYLYRVIV